jgi:hypothetical protein
MNHQENERLDQAVQEEAERLRRREGFKLAAVQFRKDCLACFLNLAGEASALGSADQWGAMKAEEVADKLQHYAAGALEAARKWHRAGARS